MKSCKKQYFNNTMILWSLLNRRLKTLLTICSLSILFISSALVYRALTSNISMNNYNRHSVSVPRKRIPALQLKHNDFYTFEEFRKDLMFANLIPGKYNTLQDTFLMTPTHKKVLTDFLNSLYPTDWTNTSETDEVALDLKYLLIDCGLESKMSCKQIDSMILRSSIFSSQSKYIHIATEETSMSKHDTGSVTSSAGLYQESEYVIKSSVGDKDTRLACMGQIHDVDKWITRGGYRLLREVLLLNVLRHPGIALMKGYCLRGNRVAQELARKGIIIVMELGIPLSVPLLESCTWSQRVSMALQVVKLLLYLDNTPIGSLRFKKLTLSDFILVRGAIIKLADVDDLDLGNLPCKDNSQCHIKGRKTDVNCTEGFCDGLNPMMNLDIAARMVLRPLLVKPPGFEETILVSRLDPLNITLSELVIELKIFFEKSPPEGPVQFVWSKPLDMVDNRVPPGKKYHIRDTLGVKNSREENHPFRFIAKRKDATKEVLSNFIRHDHRSYVGIYDYFCPGSHVSWGCVLTVTSLLDAANLCLNDLACQCFVALSNHPESDSLMKVVLKNGTDSDPLVFSDTTLFVRRPQENNQREGDSKAGQHEKQKKMEGGTTAQNSSSMIQTCLSKVLKIHKSIHHSREKRLMAHLGLEGLTELVWKKLARKQNLDGQIDIIKLDSIGGKFIVNFTENLPNGADIVDRKIMFISEEEPHVSHKAYAVQYHLDRMLGLYHTPPCVSRRLSAETVEHYQHNPAWNELFQPLIKSDGTLPGILVPAPMLVKDINLTLQPLKAMTSKIVLFDQTSKYQLEYILLMCLSRMERISNNLGYKDHLIHFSADRAFTSVGEHMGAFLYHCQFPSHVYQALACLRCDKQGKTTGVLSNVCFLGEEVIRRTHSMFADGPELLIHGLLDEDLILVMNTAAKSVLHIVDACIKNFGQDNVLY